MSLNNKNIVNNLKLENILFISDLTYNYTLETIENFLKFSKINIQDYNLEFNCDKNTKLNILLIGNKENCGILFEYIGNIILNSRDNENTEIIPKTFINYYFSINDYNKALEVFENYNLLSNEELLNKNINNQLLSEILLLKFENDIKEEEIKRKLVS